MYTISTINSYVDTIWSTFTPDSAYMSSIPEVNVKVSVYLVGSLDGNDGSVLGHLCEQSSCLATPRLYIHNTVTF